MESGKLLSWDDEETSCWNTPSLEEGSIWKFYVINWFTEKDEGDEGDRGAEDQEASGLDNSVEGSAI